MFSLLPRAPCLLLAALTLAGCVSGPDFTPPAPAAPADWTSWRSSDASLRMPVATAEAGAWWLAFGDPLLDRLQQRASAASPDLRTALLRHEQSQIQVASASARSAPELNAGGGAARQRQSENGASTRVIDAIGGKRDRIAGVLSAPFTLLQAGLDASWEPDLWGRVRRSVEAAEASAQAQAALLDLAQLTLASDLASAYMALRTTQRLIALARAETTLLAERTSIVEARVRRGLIDHLELDRQRAELDAASAQLPVLLAQEGAGINQIALLAGELPGALRAELAAPPALESADRAPLALPDLALGLPSELALRRPDIRAAEARLHRATASIGVARADLYPGVRIGARAGFESYQGSVFGEWGSRAWSVGPSLSLPLFDGGRRKAFVVLRELEQQEAAVHYQQTVLRAWHEIDDALSACAAQQQQAASLAARLASASDAVMLATARHAGGSADATLVMDSRRAQLQARRELAASDGRLAARFIALNRAVASLQPLSGDAAGQARLRTAPPTRQ